MRKDHIMDIHNRDTTIHLDSHSEYTGSHRPASIITPPVEDWSTFVDGDTTPDISESSYWKTANTSATTITNFDNPQDNIHKITVLFTEGNTTISNNSNVVIQAGADFTGVVDSVKVFLYDGTNWVEQAVNVGLVGAVYFPHDSDVSDIGGYDALRRSPADHAETTHVTNVASGDGDVAIEEFVTDAGDPGVLALIAGIWEFHVHAQVNTAVGITNLKLEFYKRATGGSETLIFSTEQEINSTSPEELEWSFVQLTDTAMDLTDRLVVKFLCNTTSVPQRTITTYYEGTDRTPHIHTPVTTGASGSVTPADHGELDGLADDDHLQYLLTFIGANIGDIPYVNATGRLDLLVAELGSGFLVLNSRGPGLPPVWLDVQALIQSITGGDNVEIVKLFGVVIVTITGTTAVDSSGAAASESDSFSPVLPAFTDTTAVNSTGAAASTTESMSPVLPAFVFSTQVIP